LWRFKLRVREGYSSLGVENYYLKHKSDYSNPHEEYIKIILEEFLCKKSIPKKYNILDLCSGSGEVSEILIDNGYFNVKGCDPFLNELYQTNIGNDCLKYDFMSIVQGNLIEKFDIIICSFALHLAESSLLPTLLYQLSQVSNRLVIISPHKKPHINDFWEKKEELYMNKVRLRYFEKNKR
jgi:SAM-dependent methyltransferase